MPRAPRRQQGRGGGRGRRQQQSPQKNAKKEDNKQEVLLPVYSSGVECVMPCELALGPERATLAILKYLEPRPVAVDMCPQETKRILDFICCAPRKSATPNGEEDHVSSGSDGSSSNHVLFPRGPSHVKSCRGLFRLIQGFVGLHEPNLMTLGAIKTIQVMIDWAFAKVMYCLQDSCCLTDKEIARCALDQAFGRFLMKHFADLGNSGWMSDQARASDAQLARFRLICQLHGAHLSRETAGIVLKSINAFALAILRHCSEYLQHAWHNHEVNQKKGYRWNSLHLRQILDYYDHFKSFLEPFWQGHESLGVSHTLHNGECLAVSRYFPSSALRNRSAGVLAYINSSASYSIVDVAQQTLLLLLTGRASPSNVSQALGALQQTSSAQGIKAPPALAIYITAIQSLCDNGSCFKLLLPDSFRCTLSSVLPSATSFRAASVTCSADSSREIIQFFCDMLAESPDLARRMTPRAAKECSDFLKTLITSHSVREVVRESAIDDSVAIESLKSLETALNSSASDHDKNAILAEFLKDSFKALFQDFLFHPKLPECVAASMFLEHESVETILSHIETHDEIEREIIESLKRLALDSEDSWKTAFDSAPVDQRKQMLGERLFAAAVLSPKYADFPGKITCLILSTCDIPQLLEYVNSPSALEEQLELSFNRLQSLTATHHAEPLFLFDDSSASVVARVALNHVKSTTDARSHASKSLSKNKQTEALHSFMRLISEKLANSSYSTVTEFTRDVIEQMRALEKVHRHADDQHSVLKTFVRPQLTSLLKKLSNSVTQHITNTAIAVQSYISASGSFPFEELVSNTYRMIIIGEIPWFQPSRSDTPARVDVVPSINIPQFCKLISNIAMSGALKGTNDQRNPMTRLMKECQALVTLGSCCRKATCHGSSMRIVSVPRHVIEAFEPHAAWPAAPLLQVSSSHLSPQTVLLGQLRNVRSQFPEDCGPIADLVQETDTRIANLEELMSLWTRFVRGDFFEGSTEFSKLILLLVHHGIDTPMAPRQPILAAGWVSLNGQKMSPSSGICYTVIAASDVAISVDSISSKTSLPCSLVEQSIQFLSKLGLVQTNDSRTYSVISHEKLEGQPVQVKDSDASVTQGTCTAMKSPINQRFEYEQVLCFNCSWSAHPDVYIRICFELFKILLGSLQPVHEWSLIFRVGCSHPVSQVADVINDLHHRAVITRTNGLIFLASKDLPMKSSSLSQPVFVIPTNSALKCSNLQWTLFCVDKGSERSRESCKEVRLTHRLVQKGTMYPIKAPFSLLKRSSVCFSVRSASLVKIMPEISDEWCIELDKTSIKIVSLSGNFKTKTFCGPLLNAETFSDFWFSWDSNKIVFGRGLVAGSCAVLKVNLNSPADSIVSGLELHAKVMINDPTTDWIFHGISQSVPGIAQSCDRNTSLQLSPSGIRSYATLVLRAIEEVTGGPVSGYPFIELCAEYARSQGCGAMTLLRRMMCPISATPTPSAQLESGEECTICWAPSTVVFPCCSTKMCGKCLLNYYVNKDDLLLKVGATPVAKVEGDEAKAEGNTLSFGLAAEALENREPIATVNAPQLKCPNLSCHGTIASSNFWKHFKRQLQLALVSDDSHEEDTAESIDARFVSNAIKSLCSPSAAKAPFAICGRCLPNSDAICGTYHIADSDSCDVHCSTCGGIQSIGQMKLALSVCEYSDVAPSAASSFDSLGYPNISPSKLLQWFSKELHEKFSGEKAKSELLVLDADMLGSGRYKMCPRCKHGPIEHYACSNLRTHVGERNSQGWVTDNRCEVCRFFSGDANDWPSYDAEASQTAGSFLSLLYKDCKEAVKVLESALANVSEWAFECTESLASVVDSMLVARSAIISFFLDSVTSYNPDALRGEMEHGRDSINAEWGPSDCIAQLSMHCMNIRFAGNEKVPTRPVFKLVNNISYVVRVIQQHFSPFVEDVCKDILSKPDSRILKSRLRTVMPEAGDSIADALQPYRHLMVSDAMYSSAVFLLESGMFPRDYLSRSPDFIQHSRRRYHRQSESLFYRLLEFLETCNSTYDGCSPLCVLLALAFSLSTEQLSIYVKCKDDTGITAMAESLISRMSSSLSPFQTHRVYQKDSLSTLSESALKRLIISSLSDISKLKEQSGGQAFGRGTLEDDVARITLATEEANDDDGRGNVSDASEGSDLECAVDDARRRGFRRWRRKWLKRQRARASSNSDSSDSSSTDLDPSEILPVSSTSADVAVAECQGHPENGTLPQHAEGSTSLAEFGWLLPNHEALLQMLNPVNWFKREQHSTVLSVPEGPDNTAAACEALGVTPDFFSPVGSRLSDRSSSSSSASESSGSHESDDASSSCSSGTSDFSDGTYESSADSGSGSSVPSQRGNYSALDAWISKFKEQLGDSSDGVGDESGVDDEDY